MINQIDLIKKFSEIDDSRFPDFYSYKRPLERGLWILWVVKEELGIKRLTAEQIASIIRDVKEVSVHAKSINNAFTRAKGKIHIYHENEVVSFEIMKEGKKHLVSQAKEGSINVFYFEPGKRYMSRRFLSKNILGVVRDGLKIVDPYCGERTLDILNGIENKTVKFLTRVENLRERERNRFLRVLQDFKSENPNIEFRNYPNTDIHDRYIISSNFLVILGHSIKDLGGKESFAIVLNRETSKNIIETLIENFNRRWKQSDII